MNNARPCQTHNRDSEIFRVREFRNDSEATKLGSLSTLMRQHGISSAADCHRPSSPWTSRTAWSMPWTSSPIPANHRASHPFGSSWTLSCKRKIKGGGNGDKTSYRWQSSTSGLGTEPSAHFRLVGRRRLHNAQENKFFFCSFDHRCEAILALSRAPAIGTVVHIIP